MLPWSAFWDHNYFAEVWPTVGDIATNNFVRGAISGIGVINLWAAFADLTLALTRRRGEPTETP